MRDDQIIFTARLPLPPSVNELYATNWGGGKRIKSVQAKNWTVYVRGIINYPSAALHPYFIAKIHQEAIKEIQDSYEKDLVSYMRRRPKLLLEADFVFTSANNDVDNRIKALQDTVSDALGFHDTAVYEIRARKIVAKGSATYVDIRLSLLEGVCGIQDTLLALPEIA